MPKYRVRTKMVHIFDSVIEADTEELAQQIAVELTDDQVSVDCYWKDSQVTETDEDVEPDN